MLEHRRGRRATDEREGAREGRQLACASLSSSIPTSPTTAAVVVAMAGTILPATRFAVCTSHRGIPKFAARRLAAAVTKAMWPLASSSFSKDWGEVG